MGAGTVRLLKGIPMFRELSEDELHHISQVTIERNYDKKAVIFHEGGEKEAVYFIKKGLIKTYAYGRQRFNCLISLSCT